MNCFILAHSQNEIYLTLQGPNNETFNAVGS